MCIHVIKSIYFHYHLDYTCFAVLVGRGECPLVYCLVGHREQWWPVCLSWGLGSFRGSGLSLICSERTDGPSAPPTEVVLSLPLMKLLVCFLSWANQIEPSSLCRINTHFSEICSLTQRLKRRNVPMADDSLVWKTSVGADVSRWWRWMGWLIIYEANNHVVHYFDNKKHIKALVFI